MAPQLTGPGLDGPAVTVERAAELLHCSRARVFALLKEGRLVRAPRFGRETTLVTASVLAVLRVGTAPAEPIQRRATRSKRRAATLRTVPLDGGIKRPDGTPR